MPNLIIDGVTIGGTTYDLKDPNLTDEVIELRSAINSVEDEFTNGNVQKHVKPSIIEGEYLKSTGVIDTDALWSRTDYIPVDKYLTISVVGANVRQNGFFTEDKTFISFFALTDGETKEVPSNAYYVMFSDVTNRIKTVDYVFTKESYASKVDSQFNNVNANIQAVEAETKYQSINTPIAFVQGAINSTYGTLDTSSTIRISSPYIEIKDDMEICVSENFQSALFFYSSTELNGYISMDTWTDGNRKLGTDVTVPSNAVFMRISVRNKSNPSSAISPSSVTESDVYLKQTFKVATEADLVTYSDLFVPSSCPNIIYLCRDAMATRDVPPNSVYAIAETAKNQYDKVRFSVSKTLDDQYVAIHDTTINNLAVNMDGTPISTQISPFDVTLEQLNQYDWGLKFGEKYRGLQVPMLDDCIKYASMYGLTIALDFKWVSTFSQTDVDNIFAMLAKYGQLDAILFALTTQNMARFKAKSKRLSFLFAGTFEQTQSQLTTLAELLTGYNKVYLAFRPIGTVPTSSFIDFAAENNFDVMYSPIEGIAALTALGFDKGVTLMECHYIANIKSAVRAYANSLI